MNNCIALSFFLSIIVLVPFVTAACIKIGSIAGEPQTLTLEISDNDQVTVTIEGELQQSNSSMHRSIILPFVVDEMSPPFPSRILCSFQNYQQQYAVIFMYVPPDTSRFEIRAISKTLVSENGDVRKMTLNFNYSSVPTAISSIVNETDTIWQFNTVKIIYPANMDMSQVLENLPSSETTDHTHGFTFENILAKGDGILSLSYLVKGTYVVPEILWSLFYGVWPALCMVLLPRKTIRPLKSNRHWGFVIIAACTWIVTIYFASMWYLNGSIWDSATTYCPALILNSLAMINWVRYAYVGNPSMIPPEGGQFVGSKNSRTYHLPSCLNAEKIGTENQVWFADARDAADRGYAACQVCRPQGARIDTGAPDQPHE
jgi:hypothetical protein